MIAVFWLVAVLTFRAVMIARFVEAGGALPIAFAVSESLALLTTVYAAIYGKFDRSFIGGLLPCLHLVVLLFDVTQPTGPLWALWLYLLLCPVQILLRLRMGFCCTVAAPCFVTLLERWPYSVIRHPLALCELLLAFCVFVRYCSPWNAGVLLAVFAANVACVLIEERFLKTQPSYVEYCGRVRWRYAPGVW